MEQPSEFTLCLPGDPVPKGRPRVYNGHAITPKRTVRAEERLFAEFRLKYPQAKPYQCPVRLEAEFWMSHRGRPDLDNLLKLVLDSLNGVAYTDDVEPRLLLVQYLRERLMQPLNAFWQGHLPQLKSTAGYPVDAHRFRAAIEPVAKRLDFPVDQWWRCK